MIIDPRGYTVTEWSDYIAPSLSRGSGIVPKLLDPDKWQEWAAIICNLPGIVGQNPPNPFTYDDWLSWAEAFNQVVRY